MSQEKQRVRYHFRRCVIMKGLVKCKKVFKSSIKSCVRNVNCSMVMLNATAFMENVDSAAPHPVFAGSISVLLIKFSIQQYQNFMKMSKLRNSTLLLSLLNVVCVLNLVRVRTETS